LTTTTPPQPTAGPTAEEFADKLFNAALGTMETFNLYLGDRLGWLDALAEGPVTAAELTERTKTQPRYAIEWLEMMAVYGNMTVTDDAAGDRLHRRFAMSPGAAEVLTDRHSLNYLGALPQMFAAVGDQLDKLLEAYRSGGGVSWPNSETMPATRRPRSIGRGSNRGWHLPSHRSRRLTPFFRNQASELQISDAVLAGRRSRLPARTHQQRCSESMSMSLQSRQRMTMLTRQALRIRRGLPARKGKRSAILGHLTLLLPSSVFTICRAQWRCSPRSTTPSPLTAW
jgi:hypothetical protein